MESTGQRGKIQISKSTADVLIAAGKEHWIKPRTDAVKAKGKGILHTFWLNPSAKRGSSRTSSDTSSYEQAMIEHHNESKYLQNDRAVKTDRHVEWMVELLLDRVKMIVARRNATGGLIKTGPTVQYTPPPGTICIDEVKEVITMPEFDANAVVDHKTVEISEDIIYQLHEYVASIAATYRDNPFHNFEHACHVTMSVNKLLKRIETPDLHMKQQKKKKSGGSSGLASQLHHYTHGITSDPLLLFAIVFSALIHDADHRGVSNVQLMKEEPPLAAVYREKSVAEQNSVDVCWSLLMSDRFDELRAFVFVNETELIRFRQMIVNLVLATDIFDKEVNAKRKSRWLKVFTKEDGSTNEEVDVDLKATIVIEHIIQASDVSHTMQHWHVYRKWSEKLFTEMYKAYRGGRMAVDPSSFWLRGELDFFDNYVIPLAKKLKECYVFGVSSDEYLNYAQQNRAEWEERGQEVLSEMMENVGARPSEEAKEEDK